MATISADSQLGLPGELADRLKPQTNVSDDSQIHDHLPAGSSKPIWTRVRQLGQGGQGHTFEVTDQNGCKAVQKVLIERRKRDPQSRGRMHREVQSLRTLAPAGVKVPRVLDGNTDAYERVDVDLYFVMEYIEGPTLAQYVMSKGTLQLEQSLEIAFDLLHTIQAAHRENIGHRDVKPENMILRSVEPADVCILDLGLSFNATESSELTLSDEGFDNGLITLPELRGRNEHKRALSQPRQIRRSALAHKRLHAAGWRPARVHGR